MRNDDRSLLRHWMVTDLDAFLRTDTADRSDRQLEGDNKAW